MARDRSQIFAIALAAVLTVAGASCFYAYRAEFASYRNVTGSMTPTLAVGDHMLFRRGHNVSRGDIVAFRSPLSPSVVFAKRIVGVGGDIVEIRDKRLLLNGAAMSEPYAVHVDADVFPNNPRLPEPYRSRDQFGPLKVPQNQYFVLGDNRDRSADSRNWGCVPGQNIIGKLVMVISPKRGVWRP